MRNISPIVKKHLASIEGNYEIVGLVDRTGKVYAIGADTKVLSTVFELVARPAVYSAAEEMKLRVHEAEEQNYYPDFTLIDDATGDKIAIDVKTTYRRKRDAKFWYTLGSFTSFLNPNTPTKNICFPYNEYSSHWILGFCYTRSSSKKSAASEEYSIKDLSEIPLPFDDVSMFFQEKWRISGSLPGSHNTANIGSIKGTLGDFEEGRGVFHSEEEYLEYWRGYRRTKALRDGHYNNIEEFRARKRSVPS